MKQLTEILQTLTIQKIVGSTEINVRSVQTNSLKCEADCLFVAVIGTNVDGHNFIADAIVRGAKSVLCSVLPQSLADGVTYVVVDDTSYACSIALSNYYDNPSSKMKVVGVTGTNGKTTTATLLYRMFKQLGYSVGLLSTVVNYIGNRRIEATHTTPDPVQLYDLLNQMVEAGCDYCFMEVSSHSIHQNRVAGIAFAGGIFSNITRDHLDYHKTFDAYIAAKKKFFDNLPSTAFALVNDDDKNGSVMIQNTKALKKTYSLKSFSDFKCKILEADFNGMMLMIDGTEVWVKFIGGFNAYNLLAVYSAATLLGLKKTEILSVLSTLTPVDGRFECFVSENGIMGIVDYAHTPDALENVLTTISQIRTNNEQVITVVGAGGDRDKGKRPMMANIAAKMSDKLIITSDNPRSEDPSVIAAEMRAGVEATDTRKVLTIIDRREAIRTAVMLAQPKDIILIAGKGHEDYQIIAGVKNHFDDREELKNVFAELKIK